MVALYATQGSLHFYLDYDGILETIFRQGNDTVRLVFREIALEVAKGMKGSNPEPGKWLLQLNLDIHRPEIYIALSKQRKVSPRLEVRDNRESCAE